MKLPPFCLHRPSSLAEASGLIAELGEDAAPYCGGTELLLAMKLGLTGFAHLVDLKGIAELRGVAVTGQGGLRIGAAATHTEIQNSPAVQAAYPELAAMHSQIANIRVRSAGTVGGNLCFADPHSDPATFLIAAGASLRCQKGDRARSVPADAFLTGPYQTALEPGELLTAVEVPARAAGTGLAHQRMKLTERPVVTVTALVTLDRGAVARARLVVGSVGFVPMLAEAADGLTGASPRDFAERASACARQAAQSCEPSPDGECPADYLSHLVEVFSLRALSDAFAVATIAS